MIAKFGWNLSLVVAILLAGTTSSFGADFSTGVQFGCVGAPGAQVYVQASDFASDLPIDLRLGLEYASPEPGSPTDARRIFINNATNGVVQESGNTWGYRLDLAYQFPFEPIPRLYSLWWTALFELHQQLQVHWRQRRLRRDQ
jgi:hypothetical protein